MKSKLFAVATILVVCGMFVGGRAFAMPSDADSDTSQLHKVFPAEMSLPPDVDGIPLTFGFGTTTDYVYDRNLDNDADLDENVWTGGTIYYDPDPKVHLSVFLGSAWLKVGSVPINNNTTTKVTLDADAAFAIGGGAKVDVIQFDVISDQPQMNLFVSGGYRNTNPSVKKADGGGFNARSQSLALEINEWQATAGVSQRINNPVKLWLGWDGCNFAWVPYLGVQYTDLDLNITGVSVLPSGGSTISQSVRTGHYSADEVVNIVTGMQIIGFDDKVSIGVEGRFIAETAISLNARFRW